MKGHENLQPFAVDSPRTKECASKGAKACTEVKHKKKLLRDLLNELMEKQNPLMLDENGDPMTNAAIMAVKAIDAASGGDWKAWELVRDTAGQKPIEKIMVADVDAEVVEQIENMVLGK